MTAIGQQTGTALLALPLSDLAGRITTLLAAGDGRQEVRVDELERAFGGNARRAWAFRASWSVRGEARTVDAIMLSQVERAQVEAELAQEHALLEALVGTGARTPRPLALDATGEVIGAPSIILERLPGTAKATGILKAPPSAASRSLICQLAEVGAAFHTADVHATGLDGVFDAAGRSAHELAAENVALWERRFTEAAMEPHPILAALFGWLREHLPEPPRLSLVHGDFRVGNFLYRDAELTGLLDWEMAHLGDPIEDVAWAYRAFWSPEAILPLDEFVAAYEAAGGPRVAEEHLRYYRIFTEVKFATISLRAAKAFDAGRTRNLRLADRAATVTTSLRPCLEWISTERAAGRA